MTDTLPIYTFGVVQFSPKAADEQPRVDPYASFTSERHVPYSGLTIFDIGGRAGGRHYKVTCRINPDLMATFEAMLLTSDVLQVDGTTYPGATLINLSNKRITPRREYYWIDAEWMVA